MSWALKSERVGRFGKLAGNEFQTGGAIKLKERSPTDLRLRLGIFKSFSFDDRKYPLSHRGFDSASAECRFYALQRIPEFRP